MRKVLPFVAALSLLLATPALAQSDRCAGYERAIVFAELGYDSADILTDLARIILEEGFGCATEAIPGATLPILQGLIRGDIDVNMEVWTDNTPEFWIEARNAGSVRELSSVFDDAAQGFYVPRYLVEGDAARGIEALAPNLKSVADLPQYASLFRDPEEPNKGRLYNCVIGWYCEGINNVKMEAYGLNASFTNFRPGTGVALEATMEAAFVRGEPWLGYYWEPTGILGRLDMLRLEEPPYSDACFAEMNALAEANTPERATVACDYPIVVAVVALGSRFAGAIPGPLEAFLDAFYLPTATINELLAFIEANDASTLEAATAFMRAQPEVWGAWLAGVDPAVRERVAASLQ
jgi:ABC-type proline/glycine betaine transport system substrate-binding protein